MTPAFPSPATDALNRVQELAVAMERAAFPALVTPCPCPIPGVLNEWPLSPFTAIERKALENVERQFQEERVAKAAILCMPSDTGAAVLRLMESIRMPAVPFDGSSDQLPRIPHHRPPVRVHLIIHV